MHQVTPAQALRNAIAAEAAAARFYESLALRSDDPEVRRFFENMIRVEKEHGDEIERVGKQFVAEALPAFADEDVAAIETVPTWKDAEGLGFDEALHIALARCFSGDSAAFLEQMAVTEQGHANSIEDLLTRLREEDE